MTTRYASKPRCILLINLSCWHLFPAINIDWFEAGKKVVLKYRWFCFTLVIIKG